MEAPPEKCEWTGVHTWTIDYVEMHHRAKAKREVWLHSDPFVIGGHEFTFMVSGTGFEKNDTTPFGVFLCPSKELSGCLLTRFKIHLRFNGVDPLPSGQVACKDFWEDETKGGYLGYNWGFQTYCGSVTHRDLVDSSSPYFQGATNRPIIIVDLYLKICKDFEEFIQESIKSQFSGDARAETGHVGIKNQGATCYLNSLMQALYHTAFLREAVFQIPSEAVPAAEVESDSDDEAVGTVGVVPKTKKKSKAAAVAAEPAAPVPDSVVLALQRVFYRLQFSQGSVGTKELTRSFGWDARESFTQHDVQELDRVLCDNLETKMKGTPGENTLKWLFCGKMRNYIRCCNVEYKSERIEEFYDLSLNVKGIPTILGSFRHLNMYVEAERMQGDNKYKPNDEIGYQDADRGTEFAEFPAVLHLHLKRFEYDWERDCMAKINDRYEFTETMDLSEFCHSRDGAEPCAPSIYKLHSVMVHSGDVFGGHYYAYIRPKCTGEQWFKFDDDRVSAATPEQAIDSNFGVTPSQAQANIGFKRCSNAYMLVYVRECDIPKVCKDVPLESVPLALRQRFDAEQASDVKKQEKKLQEKFNVSITYCTEDDLKSIAGKGLLPDDHTFRTLTIRKSASVATLRQEFSAVLKCEPSDVMILNYRSHVAGKHAANILQRFSKSYENNDEPVFRLLEKEKGNGWDNMIAYVCRRGDVANTRQGIQNVALIKAYDAGDKSNKFLGLLNLVTMTYNEVHANVGELLVASGGGPYLPDFRLFFEPAFMIDAPQELTKEFRALIPHACIIVAEVMKQETPDYVPGEFMRLYRDIDNMVTLELRHAASPGEDVHPTFKHRCLRTVPCQTVVETIAQLYGLNPSFVRLLHHDSVTNAPKKNVGFTLGQNAVEMMFDYVRKLHKEHVLHFEVLAFDVGELRTKKQVNVFLATPSANLVVKDLLPFEWNAAQICQYYQEQHPSLAGANLRVLLVTGNRLFEQLSGNIRILDKMGFDAMRIEITPPSHADLPPHSILVPVQLFNKNAGPYLLTSLIPHPFFIRVDPESTSTVILREILSEMQRLIPSTRARAESPPPPAAAVSEHAPTDAPAAPAAGASTASSEVAKSVVVRGKTPDGHSFRVTLWAFHGMKSLSLGPDDVILDKMHALSDMCVTQFLGKQAVFDSISVLCEVSGAAVSHAIKIHN